MGVVNGTTNDIALEGQRFHNIRYKNSFHNKESQTLEYHMGSVQYSADLRLIKLYVKVAAIVYISIIFKWD